MAIFRSKKYDNFFHKKKRILVHLPLEEIVKKGFLSRGGKILVPSNYVMQIVDINATSNFESFLVITYGHLLVDNKLARTGLDFIDEELIRGELILQSDSLQPYILENIKDLRDYDFDKLYTDDEGAKIFGERSYPLKEFFRV